MCGIAGFVDFTSKASKPELIRMADAIRHRGPDADGYYFEKKEEYVIGLGHRRLSIIDLSPAGNQPMQFLNGKYWIVFNGEVYNYNEIKETLIGLGHRFETSSDTEVILHAYHEWREEALTRFIGMFAFVIYDTQGKKVFCCRDRAGVKPFFYYWKDDIFLFGSELKALIAHPRYKKEININSVASFMQFGYVPAPYCIFQHTHKLEAGHSLTIDLTKKKMSANMYWNVYNSYNREKLEISMSEAIGETEKILTKAFNYRMVADVPVGVFLSGGYDSTCLTALLQKDRAQKLKTFTIGMTDEKLNEAPYAKEIAGIIGTDHHEYYCTKKDALEIIPDLPYFYDEPFADNSAIPTMLVSKMARKVVTVALSADAGDEIFGGYNRYESMLKYHKKMNAIPSFLRKSGSAFLNTIQLNKLPLFRKDHIFQHRYEKLATLLKDPSPLNLFMGLASYSLEKEKRSLIRQPIETLSSAHYNDQLQENYFDPLTYAMAKDYQTYMIDDILQKVDRATMSVSLEGREPFLDQHVIEWVGSLPVDYKIYNGKRKYILRQIVHKYVPEKIMDRPKMGFVIPISNWLETALKPLVDKYFTKDFIDKQDIFDYEYVNQMKQSFYKNKKEREVRIWFLLMFQMWYDKWINGH